MEEKFRSSLKSLKKCIEFTEKLIEENKQPWRRNEFIENLQPMYERYSIAEYFYNSNIEPRLEMLQRVHNDGSFIFKDKVEQLEQELRDKMLFSSKEYQDKLYKYQCWEKIGMILFTPFFVPLCIWLFFVIYNKPTSLGDIRDMINVVMLFGVYYVYFCGSIVTIPLSFFIGFYLVPHIAGSILLDGKYDSETERSNNIRETSGTVAAVATAMTMHKYCKNYKKPNFR